MLGLLPPISRMQAFLGTADATRPFSTRVGCPMLILNWLPIVCDSLPHPVLCCAVLLWRQVAQALDAIATMLDATADKVPAAEGKATKSVDTLTNLSAYLTLYRWAVTQCAGCYCT
jgi:hypothetical protein